MARHSFAFYGLAAAVAGVAGLALYGSSQIMSPRRSAHRDDPAAWGLDCEEVEFRSSDGLRLRAWLARGSGRNAVIVLHGHGGNRHNSLAYAAGLYPDFTLLIPDLRGHGESEGRHTSVGYHERLDVIAAAAYLRALGCEKVGVLGISMGGATAILAAAKSQLIDAVVADSAFAILRDAVREGARIRGYPAPITSPLAYLSCRTTALRLRYHMQLGDPLGCVAAIAPRPLLIIHGEADSLIRLDNAHALYAAAGQPKELWTVPGVGHARVIEEDSAAYGTRIKGFFQRWL
jgi:pimeloyl-ACP methyl ester carboxylesterase